MTQPATTLDLRNADLLSLSKTLEDIAVRATDVVVPGRDLTFSGGLAVVKGVEPVLSENGVTDPNGLYRPTLVGEEGLSSKLDIPLSYVRKMSNPQHAELLDQNLNYWLAKENRTFMLRLLRTDKNTTVGDEDGYLRAFLSDRFFTIDNLDVVLAALEGIQAAGIDPHTLTINSDLTVRRMYVRITSNEISANALALVKNYKDAKTGRTGTDYPLINAGIRLSNSEVGQGGFNVTPYATFLVCTNGQTWTKDALTKVHIGGKLEEGVVRWSQDTQTKALQLVTAQTRDAVAAFMSADYLETKVAEMVRESGVVVDQPAHVIENVSRKVGFSKDQAASILNAFIDGGDRTTGGIMQAVTTVARDHRDADVAADMQDRAVEVLHLAAVAAR